MKLTVKYFGMLTEVTGCQEEIIPFNGERISELLALLTDKYPGLKQKHFQVAHAMEIADMDTRVTKPEIALLPPFSGG